MIGYHIGKWLRHKPLGKIVSCEDILDANFDKIVFCFTYKGGDMQMRRDMEMEQI